LNRKVSPVGNPSPTNVFTPSETLFWGSGFHPSTCASSNGAFKGIFWTGESLESFGLVKPYISNKSNWQLFNSEENKENKDEGNIV